LVTVIQVSFMVTCVFRPAHKWIPCDPGLDRYSGVRQKRSLKISKGSTANFSTPRALHILASSAGYILFECVLWTIQLSSVNNIEYQLESLLDTYNQNFLTSKNKIGL
jgi:hypothetical protein